MIVRAVVRGPGSHFACAAGVPGWYTRGAAELNALSFALNEILPIYSLIEALQKMGSRAWAEASNGGRRFPPDADPGLLRWTADEMGKADVELLVAGTRWVSDLTAAPYLPRIKAPVLGLYPLAGPIAGDEQVEMLRARVPNIRIMRLPTRYHCIQSFMPAVCALEALHFVAQHDGVPCHE